MNEFLQLAVMVMATVLSESRKTYIILCLSAAINAVAFLSVSLNSSFTLILWVAINGATLIAILRYGDIHKHYQCAILYAAMILNLLAQLDVTFGSSHVYEDYRYLAGVLTVLQFIGAAYIWPKKIYDIKKTNKDEFTWLAFTRLNKETRRNDNR